MRISNSQLIGKKQNGIEVTIDLPPELEVSLRALLEEAETPEELLKEIALESASDEQAIALKDFYPFWDVNHINKNGENKYLKGTRVRYSTGDGIKLFEVEKDHKPQADWEPHLAVSLYKNLEGKIVTDEEGNPTGEHPDWVRPTNAQTAYALGAIVKHGGKLWKNTGREANDFEPGVWGWTEVKD